MENCLGVGVGWLGVVGLDPYEHLKLEICDLFSASDCKVQEQEAAKYLDHLNSPWDDGLEKYAPFLEEFPKASHFFQKE